MKQEIFRAVNVNVPSDKGHGLVNLNFSIQKGEVLGILGSRYAGRNKIFKLITEGIGQGSGSLLWGTGKNGEIPQIVKLSSNFKLIDELSVWENMAILWGKRSLPDVLNVHRLQRVMGLFLEDYGMQLLVNKKVKNLSQIEKLSLEILAAHHNKTDVLLIDGTDIEGTTTEYDKVEQLLVYMKQEGMSIVYFNYQTKLLFSLSDRIAILHEGRIIKIIEKEQISSRDLKRIFSGLYSEEKSVSIVPCISNKEVFSVKNLNIGFGSPISFSLNKGEFVTIVSPNLELFSILQKHVSCGGQSENYPRIYFLNTLYLDQMIEELSPMENLCLGLYKRVSFWGIEQQKLVKCLEQEFYDWYGHEGMLRAKDCRSLYRKDRIAINLFYLRLLKAEVIICNDFSIHNDVVTYQMVRNCLAELLDKGTAVCMITGDMTYHDDIVGRYIFLENDYA